MTSHQINSQSSQAKIRAELRSFLRDKAEWPSYRDFQRAGLKEPPGQHHPKRWRQTVGRRDGSALRRAPTRLCAGVD
jgi:hypothetical protein